MIYLSDIWSRIAYAFCSTLMTVFFKWWKYSLTIERPRLLENACRVLYSLGQVRKSVLCSNCFYFIVLKCTLKNWTSSYDYQINIYSIWLLIIKSSYNIFYIFQKYFTIYYMRIKMKCSNGTKVYSMCIYTVKLRNNCKFCFIHVWWAFCSPIKNYL